MKNHKLHQYCLVGDFTPKKSATDFPSVVTYAYKPSEGKIRDRRELKMQKGTENNPFCCRKYGKDCKQELAHLPSHHVLKREWIDVKRKQP